MKLPASLILASGVLFAADAIAAPQPVEGQENDGLREEPGEVHLAPAPAETGAAPAPEVALHEADAEAEQKTGGQKKARGVTEKDDGLAVKEAKEVERYMEHLKEGKLDGEDKEKTEEVGEAASGVAVGFENLVFHSFVQRFNEAQCKGPLVRWNGLSGCQMNGLGVLCTSTLLTLANFALWWVLFKGKPRAWRTLSSENLAETPYGPLCWPTLGVCSCWSMRTTAVVEACCCNMFMWGETMVRSRTMPLPVVVLAALLYSVVSHVFAGVQGLYCCFRLAGRIQLRSKLTGTSHLDPAFVASDCLATTFCVPCAVAQETEYLELKAHNGQPATVADANLEPLLESKPEQI